MEKHPLHSKYPEMQQPEYEPKPGKKRKTPVQAAVEREERTTGEKVPNDPAERIEAYLLYVTRGTEEAEIVSLRSSIDDGGARLKQLLSQLRTRGVETFRFSKVHPAEISQDCLETVGFRAVAAYRLYAATARSG